MSIEDALSSQLLPAVNKRRGMIKSVAGLMKTSINRVIAILRGSVEVTRNMIVRIAEYVIARINRMRGVRVEL